MQRIAVTEAEIERHRSRETDAAETACRHLNDQVADWYWLPADPATLVPSMFCCRSCIEACLSEGAKPREHA
ncbi:hypothetical protein Hden_1193 [Hyphomicrobium denitrificans ATCC 51888]|uniref:Uncharacterized protein n=1 Tax=Hyphomicrobium denitrificans (strain ATCC 51888 / DSM 1869 / NCIMB 11706 / TK 0415) TaxID=582899 RepID=D8JVW7_HYPDA|nr:hypothetical protein Hden_1193 [Hyphomicrobium denitrificans ATCC 51888]